MNFDDPKLRSRPESDEFEISLFGPGTGECLVLHVGNGDWFIVDSCTLNKTPVAETYLRALGVLESLVRGIVLTHWHDDHIGGASRLVAHFDRAEFYCSGALKRQEFLRFVASRMGHRSFSDTGADEFGNILKILAERRKSPHWLNAGTRFWNQKSELWALSPSATTVSRGFESVSPSIPELGDPKNRVPNPTPNALCVAIQASMGARSVLLGSDLEVTGDVEQGWRAVVANHPNVSGRSSLFKVAHHGSPNAHFGPVYEELLHDAPVAILTPFRQSKLPSEDDLVRIRRHSGKLYLAAPTKPSMPKKRRSAVEKSINSVVRNRVSLAPKMGLIRVRWRADEAPRIELFGAAHCIYDSTSDAASKPLVV